MTEDDVPAEPGFVTALVSDPNEPPETVMLVGFPGRSSEEGHIRLYLDPQLSEFVDVPEADVLHSQAAPTSAAALETTCTWVRRNAELVHGKAGPHQLKTRLPATQLAYPYQAFPHSYAAPSYATSSYTPHYSPYPYPCWGQPATAGGDSPAAEPMPTAGSPPPCAAPCLPPISSSYAQPYAPPCAAPGYSSYPAPETEGHTWKHYKPAVCVFFK